MKIARAYPRSSVRRLPLVPWLGMLFAGAAALGAWFLIVPALRGGPYYGSTAGRFTYGYNWPVLLLFAPYALALLAWMRGSRAPTWLLLGGAVALHLLVAFAPLAQSQDFYQYLFYGRMQAVHGANPYLVHPSVFYRDAWYASIRWPNQTSVYGPVWSFLSFSAVKGAGGSLTRAYVYLKMVVLALDFSIIAMIVAASRRRRDPGEAAGWGLLVYAWNPLILITVPLGGLADVGVAAGLIAAMVARRKGRNTLATVLLALASLVKIYAAVGLVLHLVLLFRQRGHRVAAREGALALGLGAAAFAPYWAGLRTFRGVVDIANHSNPSLMATIQHELVPVVHALGFRTPNSDAAAVIRWIAALGMATAMIWAVRKVRSEVELWGATLTVLVAYVLLTPWFQYWYLVAPLAMVAVLPRRRLTFPLLMFSATSLVTVTFIAWPTGQLLQTALRYTPPVALYVYLRRRSGRRVAAERANGGTPAETERRESKPEAVVPMPERTTAAR